MIQRYDFLQCALSRVWTEDNPWQKQDYRSMSSRCMVAMDDGEPSLRGITFCNPERLKVLNSAV